MKEREPITRHTLWLALLRMVRTLPPENTPDGENVGAIAKAICEHQLELAIMPGVRPATSFEACFQAIYGQSLDGKPCKPKTKRKSPAQAVG